MVSKLTGSTSTIKIFIVNYTWIQRTCRLLMLTTVSTLPGFWMRSAFTTWNTSTMPSVLQHSVALMNEQNTPHRLTVSLQCVCVRVRVCVCTRVRVCVRVCAGVCERGTCHSFMYAMAIFHIHSIVHGF